MVTPTKVLTEPEMVETTVTVTVVYATGTAYVHVHEVMAQLVCDCQCVVQSSTRDTNAHNH